MSYPRNFLHVFFGMDVIYHFMRYRPEMDPHFYTRELIDEHRGIINTWTYVWHCDLGCYHNIRNNVNGAKRIFKQNYEEPAGRMIPLGDLACFVFHRDSERSDYFSMLFPCPDCVLASSKAYTITATTCASDIYKPHIRDYDDDDDNDHISVAKKRDPNECDEVTFTGTLTDAFRILRPKTSN